VDDPQIQVILGAHERCSARSRFVVKIEHSLQLLAFRGSSKHLVAFLFVDNDEEPGSLVVERFHN